VQNVLTEVHPDTFHFLPKFEVRDSLLWLSAWSVLGLGSIPSQDVFQRVMSSGSEKIAVRSCFIAAGMYLTIAILPLFISLCAKHLYPHLAAGDTQLALPNMVLMHASLPVQIMFFGSLLSAIMSTTSSAILAPAAIFSENLIKPLTKERFNDKQLLNITRICVLGFSIVATTMACVRSDIYELVGQSSVLSLVSLFAPLTLGLYWKKANSVGAVSAMVLGTGTWAGVEYLGGDWPSLLPATIVSFVAMIVGSLITQKREQHENKN
ncbi:MAG: sodium:solute symporter family transporter, partial [Flammeovirgaceae bacterium]